MEDTTNLLNITGKAISGEWGSEDLDGSGIPVLRTTNFTNEGEINYNDVVTRKIVKKNLKSKFLINGDIIIEKSGGSENQPVGRVVYFDGNENTYLFNNFTGLLRVKDTKKWNSKYVFWSLYAAYKQGRTRLYQNKTTGLHNLKTDVYVRDMQIRNRDIEDQVKIAYILSKTRRLIKNYKEKISKFDELIKARFVEMFGDPICNSLNKPVNNFINVVKLQRGFDLPIRKRNSNGDIPVFGSNGILGYHTEFKAENGIITGRSGTIGSVYREAGRYWPLNTSLFSVDTYGNNIVYLQYLLKLFHLERFCNGAGVPTLNRNDVHRQKIISVPLSEQNEFANFVQQVDKSKFENIVYLNKTLSSKILSQLGDAIRD